MSKRPTANFIDVLADSGIPVTPEALEAQLKNEVSGAGSNLSNDSEMSPFWRWVRSAVITPVIWLIRTLLAGYVMPNMFVATAGRWALVLKAWEHNVTPKDAVKTRGYITLTKNNAADAITVPAGTIIQTLPIDSRVYKVIVVEETLINAGQSTGKVMTEAEQAGAAYNLPAGYFNILPSGISGINAAINEPDWITRLGADVESDEELALRIQTAFTSSGEWHIDDVYRSIISQVAGIRSDNIFFENTGHIIPGSANAYILMEVGETPPNILQQLNQHIMDLGHHGHGDLLTCLAIPDSHYDVVTEIVLVNNLSDQQIVNALLEVEDRVRAAFRETAAYTDMTRARPLSRFSLSQLGAEIHGAMAAVESVRFIVNGQIQQDIVSGLQQPRLATLIVKELDDE
ncbi:MULTISPECIES: baseplate J/gp47 family protein [unclassified Vibrio]|uniref:baseplate J/gp47 family protein n=1 Tax=unclassified Vibrio TaxID=2614977 RepID=UPI0027C98EFD|nr:MULTISPECIES: baseplate J/gp47 family protein [unclassified Vibrio]MDQ2108587.1 hypothetical protein [Vibrio sp. 2017_1457_15]MDQ2161734.1 hypothetical protein [Vibrio sp. 2017_1457_13]